MDDLKFKPFFEKMDELRKNNPKVASRIARALYYFRHSLLHSDPIDRFEDAWVSLEVLGAMIRKKFDLPTKQTSKCKGCGKVFDSPDSAAGVDYIIETLLKENLSLARSLRNKRNGIQHGFDSLEDVLKDIKEFTAVAHRGITAGVGELLGFVGEKIGGSKTFLPIVGPAPILIKAILHELPIEAVNGAERYPQLVIHAVERVVQSKKEEHAGQNVPLAMKILVKIINYTGSWDLRGAGFDFVDDPENSNNLPEIIVRKLYV